eukprot:scaffold533904_cov17-Prasinocladus_malaysianus.AAC.1
MREAVMMMMLPTMVMAPLIVVMLTQIGNYKYCGNHRVQADINVGKNKTNTNSWYTDNNIVYDVTLPTIVMIELILISWE